MLEKKFVFIKKSIAFLCAGVIIFGWHYYNKPISLTLWSWKRTDDLSFIDGGSVAPLVASIFVDQDGVSVQPRSNILTLGKNVQIIPVIRLEISPRMLPVTFLGG